MSEKVDGFSVEDRCRALKVMQEAGWRVMRVRMSARLVLDLVYRQFDLPLYADFPDLRLPDGYKVVPGTLQLDRWGNCWEVLIAHPSFPEVLEGVEPPVFGEVEGQPRPMWRMYALATEEEVRARPIPSEGEVPAPVASRDQADRPDDNPFYARPVTRSRDEGRSR